MLCAIEAQIATRFASSVANSCLESCSGKLVHLVIMKSFRPTLSLSSSSFMAT